MYVRLVGFWILWVLAAGAAAPGLHAQQATLRGFVTDAADGEPLQGANVVLFDATGAPVGASTGRDGYFIVGRLGAGRYRLHASFVGYVPFVDTLAFASGEQKVLNVALVPGTIEADEVIVEGEGAAQAALPTAGLQTIRSRDVERIPLPDVSGDLMSYLQVLPGLVSTGDRGGQLFVRGGTAAQNLVLLDRMPVYQPFHLLSFFSAFPAEILQQADVYAGGFGARYGGRLSSVIDVSTRNGDKQRAKGSASVAPFLSALHLEGPVLRDRTSFVVSARESLVERLVPGLWRSALPFRFGDRLVKIHSNLTDGSRLSFTALQTHDRGLIDATEQGKPDEATSGPGQAPSAAVPEEEIRWRNTVYGVRYLVLPGEVPVLGEVSLSRSAYDNRFGLPGDPERHARVRTINGEAALTHLLGAYTMRWGTTLQNVVLEYDLGGIFQDVDARRVTVTEGGFYLDADLPLGAGLVLNPGLHAHVFASGAVNAALEPRVRAQWQPPGGGPVQQVSAAWGRYRQHVVGLQDERDAGDVFTAWVPSPHDKAVPEAMHAIAGVQLRLLPWLEAGLEGYYKTMTNLSIPAWSAFPRFTTRLQRARGRAEGLDVRLEVERGSFYGYVGYGLSRVTYFARQESFGVWFGTSQEQFHPPHDRRHQLNALGSLILGRYALSVRWQYGSGLPFTRPIGFDDWIMLDRLVDVRGASGAYRVIFERPYQARLPAYHRLDVSLERTVPLPGAVLTLQAGLVNAYDRANLFYFDVWTLRRVDQMGLLPSFGLKLATL